MTILVAAVVVIAVVHNLALAFHLYFFYGWLDIPMHILGGLITVLTLFVLKELSNVFPERYLQFLPIILIVFVVGLGWEAFEIWAGIPLLEPDFEQDMVSDLSMDMVGGYVGWLTARSLKKRSV